MSNNRYTGSGILPISYNVIDYHPLDTRQLVPTYEALIIHSNWEHDGELVAYNGMLVVVGNEDAHKGVYYLFDKEHPGQEDYPDVTNINNWYKLKLDGDVDGVTQEELADAIKELEDSFNNTFVKNDDAFAALKQASIDNANAIKALVGQDTDSTIREISKDAAQDEISRQISTPDSALGGLVSRVTSNEDAIKALQEQGGITAEDIYTVVSKFPASVLIQNSDEIKISESNDKQLEINRIGISKLYEDVDLILHGGSAYQKGE